MSEPSYAFRLPPIPFTRVCSVGCLREPCPRQHTQHRARYPPSCEGLTLPVRLRLASGGSVTGSYQYFRRLFRLSAAEGGPYGAGAR